MDRGALLSMSSNRQDAVEAEAEALTTLFGIVAAKTALPDKSDARS